MATSKESVAALILSDDKQHLLLTKRRDIPVWVMPGGGIDEGETPEEAALREVEEETGSTARIVRLIAVYLPSNKMTNKTYLYECSLVQNDVRITQETRGIEFFPLQKLPYYFPPPYPEWLSDAQKQVANPIYKTMKSVTYFSLIKNLVLHPVLVIRFLLSRVGYHMNQD